MAKKVVQLTEYMDDLDGTVVDEADIDTISFSFRGTDYEIDLKAANAKKFDDSIKKYIDSARKVGKTRSGGGRSRPGTGSGRSKEDLAAIRHWLRQNGHEVNDRGRIPQPLIDEFDRAH